MYQPFVAIRQCSSLEKPLEELSAMSKFVIVAYQIFEASLKFLYQQCSGSGHESAHASHCSSVLGQNTFHALCG